MIDLGDPDKGYFALRSALFTQAIDAGERAQQAARHSGAPPGTVWDMAKTCKAAVDDAIRSDPDVVRIYVHAYEAVKLAAQTEAQAWAEEFEPLVDEAAKEMVGAGKEPGGGDKNE